MMWQNLIVVAVVAGAAVYLTVSYVKRRNNKVTCSACLATRNIKRHKAAGPQAPSRGR